MNILSFLPVRNRDPVAQASTANLNFGVIEILSVIPFHLALFYAFHYCRSKNGARDGEGGGEEGEGPPRTPPDHQHPFSVEPLRRHPPGSEFLKFNVTPQRFNQRFFKNVQRFPNLSHAGSADFLFPFSKAIKKTSIRIFTAIDLRIHTRTMQSS